MEDNSPRVRYREHNAVATITLDHPAHRNALSTPLITKLITELRRALTAPEVRVIVIDHTGPTFSAGADLTASATATTPSELPVHAMPKLLATMWRAEKPIIARIAGPARAGALGMIAAADIAVASTEATFAFTEVRIGAIPASIAPVVLARVHTRAASEYFLTGRTFSAETAVSIGLITAAVPTHRLDLTIHDYVDDLLAGAPNALAAVTRLVRGESLVATSGSGLSDGVDIEQHLQAAAEVSARHFLSEEAQEGMTAFAEHRPPNWPQQRTTQS